MSDVQFTGYPIELEDREALRSSQTEAVLLMMGELAERMDPRSSKLGTQGFLQVEDQGRQGSCEGNSLSECLEFSHAMETGEVIQISRQYAYIASQIPNNIRTDSGATLNGGTKAAAEGIPLESEAPYMSSYPGWGYITPERKAKAVYKLRSHTEMKSAEHIKQFLGSGIGIVQIGIPWNDYLQQTESGFITDFRPGPRDGGHAIVFAGYVPDSDTPRKSSAGWWFLLKNSHSKRYGIQGYAYVDPRAVDKMLKHQWTVMYGRSDMDSPRPRKIKFDFTKKSILG